MSDALPLPPRPNIEQYRKLAKDLQKTSRSADPNAVRAWSRAWLETNARLRGIKSTTQSEKKIDYAAEQIKGRWQKFRAANGRGTRCTLTDAQFFVAREHGFSSWPKFVKHLQGLTDKNSLIANFEKAVDAIVSGDVQTLRKLLRAHPALARARSTREHRSTLLHYVSANGVEDFRQQTPNNIVEITGLLLEAGADVNAESDAYGGRSTTLGLAATSWHPQQAGVQLPLMKVLIDNGAIIDGPDGGSAVNGCLRNGRKEAAEFFANNGATLDLEAAAGVGRLDVVKTFFDANGRLRPSATQQQLHDGFAWACEFGRTNVVAFLLDHGVHPDTRLKHHGQTGLHWAALGGHFNTVQVLLLRDASVEVKDESFGVPIYNGPCMVGGVFQSHRHKTRLTTRRSHCLRRKAPGSIGNGLT